MLHSMLTQKRIIFMKTIVISKKFSEKTGIAFLFICMCKAL
jgi:hypothetical protein